MPIYDYACTACGEVTEVIHGVYDAGPRFCPACGTEGSMRKTIAAPAIHYKGSGWAKKDRSATSSPGRSRAAGKDGEASGGAGADASSEGSGTKASGGESGSSPSATASGPAKPAPSASSSGSGD
ncbi:MAG: hypothetical protein HYX57_06825 [Chloroflexi bacterium]|nr:hypothetical protein [Chloroflexota bacterium]